MAIHLYAYGDDSGTHAGAKYCIVSGYIGSPRQWDSFRRKWRAILTKCGVPEFHSIDFFPPKRRRNVEWYKGWSDENALAFLDELLLVIAQHRITPIGYAIDAADFSNLPYDERRLLTGGSILLHNRAGPLATKWKKHGSPERPYFAAFSFFLLDAIQSVGTKGADIHFTFDMQNAIEARAVETFNEASKEEFMPGQTARLASITFADSRQEEPLQAADLHAYLWNRWLSSGKLLTGDMGRAMVEITRKKNLMRIVDANSFASLRPLLVAQGRQRIAEAFGRRQGS